MGSETEPKKRRWKKRWDGLLSEGVAPHFHGAHTGKGWYEYIRIDIYFLRVRIDSFNVHFLCAKDACTSDSHALL